MKAMQQLLAVLFGLSVWTSSFAEGYTEDIERESPGVWGISDSDDFIPHRVGIKVCKAENTVFVGFYLSQRNIDFYRQTFSDGKRKPISFEIDVNDISGVFARSDIDLGRASVSPGIASVVYRDNYQLDGDHVYTLAINDPTKVPPNTWMFWKFTFSKHKDVSPATYDVYAQLTGNVRRLREEYPDLFRKYGGIVQLKLKIFWHYFCLNLLKYFYIQCK